MDGPLAYFITIRTYGTWLSGDARGSVDDDHNRFGEAFAPRDDFRRGYQERVMRGRPFLIASHSRSTIEAAIAELCTYRDWELFALNVRTNHVHIVLAASQDAERVMGDLKAYCTRALRRTGDVSADQPVWAGHGSTRRAFTAA